MLGHEDFKFLDPFVAHLATPLKHRQALEHFQQKREAVFCVGQCVKQIELFCDSEKAELLWPWHRPASMKETDRALISVTLANAPLGYPELSSSTNRCFHE